MNDEDAFRKAVLADPDDDLPRLGFADWLEENGQPERAAFVRAQVRLAAMDEDDPARAALLRDEAAYLPTAKRSVDWYDPPAWLKGLPQWVLEGLDFERGFPARLK